MPKRAILAALFCAAAVSAQAAQGPSCGDRGQIVDKLRQQFQEMPAGLGLTGDGAIIELLTSQSGTWTLILSLPNGTSCLVAAGEGWEARKVPVAGHQI